MWQERLSARSADRRQRDSLRLSMTDFFVRPWEISGDGNSIEIQGKMRTQQEVRQKLYENIVDEALFIARASEGAVSAEWIMNQPIFIRTKYVNSFTKELQERERRMNSKKR